MNFYIVGLCIGLLIFAVCVIFLLRKFDRLTGVLAKQAVKLSEHESAIADHEHKHKTIIAALADHDKRIKEQGYSIREIGQMVEALPVEDLEAMYKAEQKWNDGVQSILSFGMDTARKAEEKSE